MSITKSAWKLSELTDPYIHQNVIMPEKSFIYKIGRDVSYDIMYTPCQSKLFSKVEKTLLTRVNVSRDMTA